MKPYRLETSDTSMWIDLDRIVCIKDPQGQCDYYGAHFQIDTVSHPITIGVGYGETRIMGESRYKENKLRSMEEIRNVHGELTRAWLTE